MQSRHLLTSHPPPPAAATRPPAAPPRAVLRLSHDLAALLGHLVFENEDPFVYTDELPALLADKALVADIVTAGLDAARQAVAPGRFGTLFRAPPPPWSESETPEEEDRPRQPEGDGSGTPLKPPSDSPLLKLAEEVPDVFRLFVLPRLVGHARTTRHVI